MLYAQFRNRVKIIITIIISQTENVTKGQLGISGKKLLSDQKMSNMQHELGLESLIITDIIILVSFVPQWFTCNLHWLFTYKQGAISVGIF